MSKRGTVMPTHTITKIKGSYDNKKNKELKRQILKILEPKYRFPCYNDWYKKMGKLYKKEYRLSNIPLDDIEKKIIKKQLRQIDKNPDEWETLPYEPFFGCNRRCGDCSICEVAWKFGDRCRKCKKNVRNLANSYNHVMNSDHILLCYECGRKEQEDDSDDDSDDDR